MFGIKSLLPRKIPLPNWNINLISARKKKKKEEKRLIRSPPFFFLISRHLGMDNWVTPVEHSSRGQIVNHVSFYFRSCQHISNLTRSSAEINSANCFQICQKKKKSKSKGLEDCTIREIQSLVIFSSSARAKDPICYFLASRGTRKTISGSSSSFLR